MSRKQPIHIAMAPPPVSRFLSRASRIGAATSSETQPLMRKAGRLCCTYDRLCYTNGRLRYKRGRLATVLDSVTWRNQACLSTCHHSVND